MTRSLGDQCAKRMGVTAEPEIRTCALRKGVDRALVVACDGVWDALSNEEAMRVCMAEYSFALSETNDKKDAGKDGEKTTAAQRASERLTAASLSALDAKQLDDNVSNVVVFFGWD